MKKSNTSKTNNNLTKKEVSLSIELIMLERVKNLQWKKDIPKVDLEIQEFIVDIIYGEKLESDHLDKLSKEERNLYLKVLQIALGALALDDRDRFFSRVENVLNEPTKNNIWEAEHVDIENALDSLTKDKRRFAARTEISDKTGYSQKTIEKHIGDYHQSDYYKKRQDDMLLMRERLLSWCYKLGVSGDMKAARLFLETASPKKPDTTINNQQNNFIQFNNLTITNEQINQLPQDKQQQMKDILLLLSKTK